MSLVVILNRVWAESSDLLILCTATWSYYLVAYIIYESHRLFIVHIKKYACPICILLSNQSSAKLYFMWNSYALGALSVVVCLYICSLFSSSVVSSLLLCCLTRLLVCSLCTSICRIEFIALVVLVVVVVGIVCTYVYLILFSKNQVQSTHIVL